MYDNDAALTTTDRIIRNRGVFALHIYPYFFRLRLFMPNLLVKMAISNPSFALHYWMIVRDDIPWRIERLKIRESIVNKLLPVGG